MTRGCSRAPAKTCRMRSALRAVGPRLAASAAAALAAQQVARAVCESKPAEPKPPQSVDPRLLYRPAVPYPLCAAPARRHRAARIPTARVRADSARAHSWDDDWDFRKPTAERKEKHGSGAVRHIILVRHGQYEESSSEDAKRVLTPLGRDQAEATGVRLAAILAAAAKNGEVKVRLHCSTLTRAVETAQIVGRHLPPSVTRVDNDPNLAEGYPAPPLPNPRFTEKVHRDSARIEAAFRSLFYRAHPPKPTRAEKCGDAADGPLATQSAPAAPSASASPPHEYEIVVCHGNVIRYFAMRALQLPPEAWLRLCTFNCSLTYLTVRPSGSVSLRLLGDTGHLPMELTTFSMHHGYDW